MLAHKQLFESLNSIAKYITSLPDKTRSKWQCSCLCGSIPGPKGPAVKWFLSVATRGLWQRWIPPKSEWQLEACHLKTLEDPGTVASYLTPIILMVVITTEEHPFVLDLLGYTLGDLSQAASLNWSLFLNHLSIFSPDEKVKHLNTPPLWNIKQNSNPYAGQVI